MLLIREAGESTRAEADDLKDLHKKPWVSLHRPSNVWVCKRFGLPPIFISRDLFGYNYFQFSL